MDCVSPGFRLTTKRTPVGLPVRLESDAYGARRAGDEARILPREFYGLSRPSSAARLCSGDGGRLPVLSCSVCRIV